MQTYWPFTKAEHMDVVTTLPVRECSEAFDEDDDWEYEESENFQLLGLVDKLSSKTARLVEGSLEVLSNLLKQIVAQGLKQGPVSRSFFKIFSQLRIKLERALLFSKSANKSSVSPRSVSGNLKNASIHKQLSLETLLSHSSVISSLKLLYKEENDFHNFDHATYATSSVPRAVTCRDRLPLLMTFFEAKTASFIELTKAESPLILTT